MLCPCIDTHKKKFLEALNHLNFNINLNFNEHSRFVINTLGVHISKLNEQTSEHMIKALKAILVQLQGFTNRAVGNSGTDAGCFSKTGFVVNDNHIHNFYNFCIIRLKKHHQHVGLSTIKQALSKIMQVAMYCLWSILPPRAP